MNTITNRLKIIIVITIPILLLFLLIVFFQNKTTLIITMNSTSQSQLNPEVYFSGSDHRFTEDKSVKVSRFKKNRYYFVLPGNQTIQYIRLDPAKFEANITIDKIIVTQSNWFKKSALQLSTDNLKPLNQIEGFEKTDAGIKFTTTGNDPHFDADFALGHISTTNEIHLDILLILILSVIVSFYLYKTHKMYKINGLNDFMLTKIILYSLFFALALFKVDYYKEHIKFGYPPDELAHLSYIDHVNKHDKIIPSFEEMYMLNDKSAGNYLSHPPLYYNIMSAAIDQNISIIENVVPLRVLNIIIFSASFLLLLYIGFSSNIGILGHLVYLTFISSIPMFAYLGGSITNDNLAIFGGSLFAAGFMKLLEQKYTNLTFFIIGAGIFLAYFSKFTAALLLFFALAFFLIYAIKTKMQFKINKTQIALLLLFMLPIFYYQVHILSHYHSMMPTFNVTHPEQYLKSVFFVPEEHRQHLGVIEWLERIKSNIIGGWFGIHSHHSFVKNSVWEYMGLLLLHLFAIAALFFKCSDDAKSYCVMGKIALFSLFSVLIIQYTFSYQAHLKSGYLGGLQPRYVLPFMFSFAILSSILAERFRHLLFFNILVIFICIQAIYSDFFYFLKYYI